MMSEIPSVESLVQSAKNSKVIHSVKVRLAREAIERMRAGLRSGEEKTRDELLSQFNHTLDQLAVSTSRAVINASGVVLHTNLGRAPFGRAILENLTETLQGYHTLEFDLETGERGERMKEIERLITLLTGAERALVVNNNAAAVMLSLFALCREKKALVSRGELVQIGGGFKVPEILEASGAELLEVGTTNITSDQDFARAFNEHPINIGAILRVHRSNFTHEGHVGDPDLKKLVELGKRFQVPVIVDEGSGYLWSREKEKETVVRCIELGVNVVSFSADKFLGGPQAGILVGSRTELDKIFISPLYRALRVSKLELFVLEKTLRGLLFGNHSVAQTLWDTDVERLSERAQLLKKRLQPQLKVSVVAGQSVLGGGSLPGESKPSVHLSIEHSDCDFLRREFLKGEHPIVVGTSNGRCFLDLRTIFPHEDEKVFRRIQEVLACTS